MPTEKPPYPSDHVVLEELRLQRTNLTRVIEALDNKLVILLGINGVITSLTVALLGLSNIELKWVFVPPTVLLLAGFVLAVCAFWPRKWAYHPSPKSLMEVYIKVSPKTYKKGKTGSVAQIAASVRAACEEIQAALKAKTTLLKISLVFEGAGVVLIGVYFIIYVIVGGQID